MSLESGSRIGRYEIVEALGAGGMGQVYRARDTRLGREVAIKVLHEDRSDPGALARFETEARAVSALDHPNIVRLYDIGQEGERTFLVMELVDGEPLRSEMGERMAVDRAVRLAAEIADALATAHRKGILHRDLKPENVLIDREGRAKVLDFGLARPFEAGTGNDDTPTATRLTQPGMILGTVGYLSPEMASRGEAEAPADQFSFGCLLYEMLAGRSAFPGHSNAERLVALLRDQPPALDELRSDVPPALAEVVSRCLAKEPGERFPDATSLCEALKLFAAESSTSEATSAASAGKRRRSRLPASRTRFFGRERELEQIGELLRDPSVRLVTLTGPGGTGKTRLALQIAERLEDELDVYFVPLAAVTNPALVLEEIARALDASTKESGDVVQRIADSAEESSRAPLIVLDNFEHLTEAADRLGDLLQAAPELQLLVTSREVLRLYGEQDFPVPPLEVPGAEQAIAVGELRELPAVALFVDRARAAKRTFELNEENAAAVAELCNRLDGLPLALELAAARIRMLTPQSMVSRLGQRLEILTGGARDLPARQRTLRDTIEWSHGLLPPEEQAAFRRLGVFAGGFTLESAEAAVDPLGRLETTVSDLVVSLVEKSLVQPLTEGDEPRFGMLEMIREYALDRLRRSEEEPRTRKAHAAYFLVLAQEAAAALGRERGEEWRATLEDEHDNLMSALDWLTESDNADWGLRVALALFPYWESGEQVAEARRRLTELVELPSAASQPELRAKALHAAGTLMHSAGDFERARRLQEKSLELHRELEDRWGVLVVLNALSICLVDCGNYGQARRCLEEALEGWKEVGERGGYARSLTNLANVARAEGRFDESRELHREAAAAFRELGDHQGLGWSLNHEADVARAEGDLGEARRLFEEALEIFRSLDERWGTASSLADLGRVLWQQGEHGRAVDLFRQALRRFAKLGHRRGVARLFEDLAEVLVRQRRFESALRLTGASAAIRERLGLKDEGRDPRGFQNEVERASDLGSDRVVAETAAGESMRWREAVDYALEQTDPSV